jgi:hypothetical protein
MAEMTEKMRGEYAGPLPVLVVTIKFKAPTLKNANLANLAIFTKRYNSRKAHLKQPAS